MTSAEEGPGNGIDMPNTDEAGHEFGQNGGQRDGGEGLDGEGRPHAAEGEIIEWQVHGKEAETEAEARRVMGEESETGRAAGKQPSAGEQRDAEHGEHAAGDDALGVVE